MKFAEKKQFLKIEYNYTLIIIIVLSVCLVPDSPTNIGVRVKKNLR